jgi:hypothetical protein
MSVYCHVARFVWSSRVSCAYVHIGLACKRKIGFYLWSYPRSSRRSWNPRECFISFFVLMIIIWIFADLCGVHGCVLDSCRGPVLLIVVRRGCWYKKSPRVQFISCKLIPFFILLKRCWIVLEELVFQVGIKLNIVPAIFLPWDWSMWLPLVWYINWFMLDDTERCWLEVY